VKIGITFPQVEIGTDPIVLRDYAQAAEGLGYTHILAYDHVLGADTSNRPPGFRAPYTKDSVFHEPFTLYSYLSAFTSTIEFVTGIIILPQRQTALVAKQAACVDVLSGGRLRLGVGLGWNAIEYESLNEDFHTRGRRMSEQVEVMRALWTQDVVEFHGRWHHIDRAGIKPLPVQRPIPVWMGGMSEPVLKRLAKIADGWFPQFADVHDPQAKETVDRMQSYVREYGRSPADVGIEGRVSMSAGTPDDWGKAIERWGELGAGWMQINTMGAGWQERDHIEAMRRFKDEVGV
jgi:probable F420-dependent oxidoreductase